MAQGMGLYKILAWLFSIQWLCGLALVREMCLVLLYAGILEIFFLILHHLMLRQRSKVPQKLKFIHGKPGSRVGTLSSLCNKKYISVF
jgi:hypothetical protein